MKIKIGIFFGGQSREREISFMGGKTTYRHIDRRYFEPVLIFVDSVGNFIQVDSELLNESDIRSFYPSKNQNRGYRLYIESLGPLSDTQLYKLIYKIGKQVKVESLKSLIDFGFLVMHGPYAEDGNIQGLLEWLNIPYLGAGILASGVGIDKVYQNHIMAQATGQTKKFTTLTKKEWENGDLSEIFSKIMTQVGFPFVIKAPHQGSSIGVAIVRKRSIEEFSKAVSQCFFEVSFHQNEWKKLSARRKKNQIEKLSSLDEGIGMPVILEDELVYHPADLLKKIDKYLKAVDKVKVSSVNAENRLLIEEFITGQEFSCGVIQDEGGNVIALPPAEVFGDIQTFDFKSKYFSSASKKRIPVETDMENLEKIHEDVIKVYKATGMSVFSRIDGFLTPEGEVVLHDPNTLPGMSPTSFIFKQLAEVGLNITDSITYLIRQSLLERKNDGKNQFELNRLLQNLESGIATKTNRKKLAILFGENEEEYEVAKAKYGEFGGSKEYEPIPVCAALNGSKYIIPMNLMFKTNISEFGEAIGKPKHPFIQKCIEQAENLRNYYAGDVDFKVKKIEENEFVSSFAQVYNCKTKELV